MQNRSVGIFVEDNYQELEFWYPYLRLQEEGIRPLIIGNQEKSYSSKLGYMVKAEVAADKVEDKKFDLIIIPGGYAPDKMRCHQAMINIVRTTYENGKIIAAICHAAWVLISAQIISGKKATCYHSIKDDLINAGGKYMDEAVVVDNNLITSRQPKDLPAFCQQIIAHLNL